MNNFAKAINGFMSVGWPRDWQPRKDDQTAVLKLIEFTFKLVVEQEFYDWDMENNP